MEEKYCWQDKQGNIYGPFRMDEEGNPHAGDVVQHYRLLKHISPKVLGKELDKSARWVQLMEKENTVPELISRRKALIRVLGIPPLLLFPNLYGDDDLVRVELQQKTLLVQIHTGGIDLRYCAEMLQLYWSIYHRRSVQSIVGGIEEKIQTLQTFAAKASGNERVKTLSLLCNYRQLAAVIARDQRDYESALMHLDKAIDIVEEVDDPVLHAAVLIRRGFTYTKQSRFAEASADLKKAYTLRRLIPTTLVGRIYAVCGNLDAHLARTPEEKSAALALLDKAGKIVQGGIVEDNTQFLKMSVGDYHLEKAETLIALREFVDASSELQEASEAFPSNRERRHLTIDMLQVRLALNSGEYAIATSTAHNVFDVAEILQSASYINKVTKVYNQLRESPYGSRSSDVRDLGEKLREWEKKTAHYLH